MRNQILGILIGAGIALLPVAAFADENAVLATVEHPAVIPIRGELKSAATGQRIVLTIDEYAPSSTGPVMAVAYLRCTGGPHEIGRFGIFPDQPFSAKTGAAPQYFAFAVPTGNHCQPTGEVELRLEPQMGDGKDARISIAGAAMQ